jgi:transcriptional regulator with XRE-family HTH domain
LQFVDKFVTFCNNRAGGILMTDNNIKDFRQDIIKQITKARVAKGLTQSQLAELLGMHRSAISRLESGSHSPSLDLLLQVASVLELKIELTTPSTKVLSHMENNYELRLFDKVLLTFSLEKRGIEGLTAHIISIDKEQLHLLPLGLELSDKGILRWLEKRVIPKKPYLCERDLENFKSVSR